MSGLRFFLIIGVFIFWGTRMEYAQVKFQSFLSHYTAKDLLMKDFETLRPEGSLKKAVDLPLKTPQAGFLVKSGDDVATILSKNDIIKGLSKHHEEVNVRPQVITSDFKKVEANKSLRNIFQTMQKKKIQMLPVYEHNKMIGVIDMENIHEFMMIRSAQD
ncbi:CBS domain-containing protein [Marinilabilia salmonicolor]|jgi:predicted transcriptional regulator|nr:CBS domain-containing protein [Marinilabilia salmonicolor]